MTWTKQELALIDKYSDLIERKDLISLIKAYSEVEDVIGEGTNNIGFKIVFGILIVDTTIPFYLQVDRWDINLALSEEGDVIEVAELEGEASVENIRECIMEYFKDPGFYSPNPFKDLPEEGLKALVDRAKIVYEGGGYKVI